MTDRVIVTDHIFESLDFEREALADTAIEFEYVQATTEQEVIDALDGTTAILSTNAPITRAVFEAQDELKVVGRYGIGVDTIDVEAASEHGIQVVNVDSYCEEEVSTHALALLLSVVRRISAYDSEVRDGEWDWMTGIPLYRLAGKTVGFAGFGKIAQLLREKMQAFDVEFVAYDPYLSESEMADLGAQKVTFETFLDSVDIASVHTPLTEETRNLFDAPAFERLNDSSILINTSRGEVVDVQSLYDAIESDQIYGAGLDVLPEEPPQRSKIREHHRIVHTPHVGWYSESSVTDLRSTVIGDVLAVLRKETPENPVNEIAQ
jgi:D-3-phosphoglycerate dehydrogenase